MYVPYEAFRNDQYPSFVFSGTQREFTLPYVSQLLMYVFAAICR